MKFTACPMDCFDACKVEYNDGVCKPSKDKITNGKLCRLFAYLQSQTPLLDKNLDETLKRVVDKLKTPNQKVLYYKGSGNLCVTQNVPKAFFEKIKATFAVGSLCEGAGEAGIEMGRGGYNVNPTIEELQQSEVILVWGRNLTQTSNHIYRLIKDKTFITIDPMYTKIAELSEVYLQVPPKSDYILAKLFQDALDKKDIDTKKLDKLGVSKEDFEKIIKMISTKKVSVMIGLGVQKYKEGAEIIHEIDKFCEKLGLLDGKNTGVWYLGDSAFGFDKISINPTNTCTYPDVKFDDYDIVFIQGANPVISAPDSLEIRKQLENTFVIYMGITPNDTSKYADIIIPAKTFLQKRDVRVSYSHDEVMECEVCEDNPYAISEYELTSYLFDAFGFDGLASLDEYLSPFKEKRKEKPSFKFERKEFDDVHMLDLKDDEYYLITSKSTKTLNSQFKYDEYAYVHPSLGFEDGQLVTISSKVASIKIKVKNDDKVFKKSILFYAGNKLVNEITPKIVSNYGVNACFQDIKINIF